MAKQDEFNRIEVHNPEGVMHYNADGFVSAVNDTPHSVFEMGADNAPEQSHTAEWQTAPSSPSPSRPSASQSAPIATPAAAPTAFNVVGTVSSLGVIGGVAGVVVTVAVYTVVAIMVQISMLMVTDSSFTFFLDVRNAEGHTLTITLFNEDNSWTQPVLDSGYYTFDGLSPSTKYTLVVQDENSEELYNAVFFTEAHWAPIVNIEAMLEQDGRFAFWVYYPDDSGALYTVDVTDSAGRTLFSADESIRQSQHALQLNALAVPTITVRRGNQVVAQWIAEPWAVESIMPHFEWVSTADGILCTARVVTDKGEQLLDVTVDISNQLLPSCIREGSVIYWATCEYEGQKYVDYFTHPLAALGHDWGNPIVLWQGDGEDVLCRLQLTCTRDEEVDFIDLDTFKEVVSPTCVKAGQVLYTVDAMWNDVVIKDSHTITLPALGHDWGNPTVLWQENGLDVLCRLQLTCSRDEAVDFLDLDTIKEVVSPTCLDAGQAFYKVDTVWEGVEIKDTHSVILPALGHTWGDVEYLWQEVSDGMTCTAQCVCLNNNAHVQQNLLDVQMEQAAATCDEEGYIRYFASEADKVVSERNIVLAALGHEWSSPSYDWQEGEEGMECFAICVCTHNEDHVQQVSLPVMREVLEATCTEDGHLHCRAIGEDESVLSEYNVVLNALGHDWQAEFGDLNVMSYVTGAATAMGALTCSRCGFHTEQECEISYVLDGGNAVYTLVCGDVFTTRAVSLRDDTLLCEVDTDGSLRVVGLYDTSATQVTIPDSLYGVQVTSIGAQALAGSNIEHLHLPETLRHIEEGAFAHCSQLVELRIPDGVEEIGASILAGCTSLTYLVLPYIGQIESAMGANAMLGYLFARAESASLDASGASSDFGGESYAVEDELVYLARQYYADEEYLAAYIPASLLSLEVRGGIIQRGALSGLASLTALTIGEYVKEIGMYALSGLDSAGSIIIQGSEETHWNLYDENGTYVRAFSNAELADFDFGFIIEYGECRWERSVEVIGA